MLKRGLDITPAHAQDAARRMLPVIATASVKEWWENDSQVERPGVGRASVTGSSGNVSWSSLVNPIDNHVDCYVERVWLKSESAVAINLVLADEHAAGAVSGNLAWRDLRGIVLAAAPFPAQPSAKLRSGSGAQPSGQACGQIQHDPSVQPFLDVSVNVLLPPGSAIILQHTAADIDAIHSWFWREMRIAR